jgi:hypothetical protein
VSADGTGDRGCEREGRMMPMRLQLSRRKGFSLQEASVAANGLAAVNVARPSKWGNPFVIQPMPMLGGTTKWRRGEERKRRYQVVEMFRGMLAKGEGEPWERMRRELGELRGKNLACWCNDGEKLCHAQVLLEMASAEIPR